MRYEPFEIEIRSIPATKGASTDGGRSLFEARVVDAPYDAWPEVHFERPLLEEEVGELFDLVERDVRSGRETTKRRRPTAATTVRLQEAGKVLYQAIFQDELERLFARCRDRLGEDDGLRIQLRIDLSDVEAPYLASLPWEALCDPDDEPLAIDRKLPIVRHLVNPRQPRQNLKVELPLRILLVEAAPSTMEALNLGLETERIQTALGELIRTGDVELIPLDRPSLDDLREALLDQTIHALHFMGHGGYHAGRGIGAVFFERPDGSHDQVEGLELAECLKSTSPLKLIVLNACKTARHAGRDNGPPHLGVAAALIERLGVPALVANQHAISDRAAIELSRVLYGRIAKGDPVEAAVTEARRPLKRQGAEWLTPILFQSARDGRLVDASIARKARTVVAPHRPVQNEPLKVGVRSFTEYHQEAVEACDVVLSLADNFEQGRYIRDERWWRERIFPELETFLLEQAKERRRVVLVLVAHQSMAFSAGWILEAKSGLDVRVVQPSLGTAALEWHPEDGSGGNDDVWQEQPDLLLAADGPDVAVALSVTRPDVAAEVAEFVQQAAIPVGRIIDATIAPEPGQRSVRGGAHCLRLAQALAPRLRRRLPHERGGRLHLFGAAPNAFLFYLGQLARAWGAIVLYEYPFGAADAFGRYTPSIELPPQDADRVG